MAKLCFILCKARKPTKTFYTNNKEKCKWSLILCSKYKWLLPREAWVPVVKLYIEIWQLNSTSAITTEDTRTLNICWDFAGILANARSIRRMPKHCLHSSHLGAQRTISEISWSWCSHGEQRVLLLSIVEAVLSCDQNSKSSGPRFRGMLNTCSSVFSGNCRSPDGQNLVLS